MSLELESVIEDAMSDAALPEDTEIEAGGQEEVQAVEAPAESDTVAEEAVEVAVESPAARADKAAKAPEDEFTKKFGIPQHDVTGRENRIPHSRVQKIVAKAEQSVEAKYAPQIQQWEARWSEQEAKNQKVAQFEDVMVKDPSRFIQTLHDNLPQYRDLLAPLFAPQQVAQTTEESAAQEVGGMPGPDLENHDGSRVYSEDGLKNLINWAIQQGETRAVSTMEQRYAPIEQSFQNFHYYQEASKKVNGEIAEARTWPQFTENEEAITKALQTDRNLSLEGAYRKVVFPRIQSDRNKMREEIMAELKKAPSSTSAPRAAGRASVSSGNGPRSLEDIIKEQVSAAGFK